MQPQLREKHCLGDKEANTLNFSWKRSNPSATSTVCSSNIAREINIEYASTWAALTGHGWKVLWGADAIPRMVAVEAFNERLQRLTSKAELVDIGKNCFDTRSPRVGSLGCVFLSRALKVKNGNSSERRYETYLRLLGRTADTEIPAREREQHGSQGLRGSVTPTGFM